MRPLLALPLLLLPAAPLAAQEALDAEGFAALVEGRTITYLYPSGRVMGTEAYHPGRRVTWERGANGACQVGSWHERAVDGEPWICFVYPPSEHASCWRFHREGEDVRGRLPPPVRPNTPTLEIAGTDGTLSCGGAGV